MQVTLAYEFDGFAPDETVEVDDLVGRELLRTGRARPADLRDATIDEVKAAVGTSPELARAAARHRTGPAGAPQAARRPPGNGRRPGGRSPQPEGATQCLIPTTSSSRSPVR